MAARARVPIAHQHVRILIADDHPVIRKMVRAVPLTRVSDPPKHFPYNPPIGQKGGGIVFTVFGNQHLS
jgi:hypothetical protein